VLISPYTRKILIGSPPVTSCYIHPEISGRRDLRVNEENNVLSTPSVVGVQFAGVGSAMDVEAKGQSPESLRLLDASVFDEIKKRPALSINSKNREHSKWLVL